MYGKKCFAIRDLVTFFDRLPQNLFTISKKNMILMIVMITMIISVTTIQKNH